MTVHQAHQICLISFRTFGHRCQEGEDASSFLARYVPGVKGNAACTR
jgi:hypothetical protein